MRDDSFLHDILGIYRVVSAIGATLVLLALAFSLAALLGAGGVIAPALWFPLGATASLLLIIVLWRVGYRQLRAQLLKAEQRRREVIEMAHRDALTGAFTRSFFMDELGRRVHSGAVVPVGYLQVDMDHLKTLNDGQGHAAGDAALLHLIQTIRQVAPDAIIGRLGGDEFGIALLGQDNKRALARLAERILAVLRGETMIAGRMTRLSATIGIAVAPHDAEDAAELMSRADLALYRGKRQGRAMAIVYDPDMLVDERHARNILRELRAALLLDEIRVYYQPVFHNDGVTLRSYEALIRWHHSHRGVVPPNQFIPIAEQSDMIDRLGEAVLRQVCSDLPRLGVPVAINVSPVQLRRPEFAERFRDILTQAGVAGSQITIEVTESVLMRAGGIETANLAELRRHGVRIAIDDLGTGHASLEYLRSFAFEVIKIDKSYIAHLLTSRIDRVIVSAVCDIARTLDVEVIAEGVETREQLEELRRLGCNSVQGYLLGYPAPLGLAVRTPAAA
ncbi:MAG TPA: bifunctional diguanylate cyclase/phosphodiesterase [Devosia sp.]|nr:bifunctional diguanylate cyclase/phosphodiesterase [Devosia sp.]